MINFRIISQVLGILISIVGVLMLFAAGVSFIYSSSDFNAILISSLITMLSGIIAWRYFGKSNKKEKNPVRKKEGYLIVALGWTLMSAFGCLPYLISGAIPDITNAFFETMSGFTTTGASILNDIEAQSPGILFWRSMTQWIGGMGIIVMTIAILPILGIGGMELFVAEVPGPTKDKLHPRIKETAKRLWAIYVILTAALFVLLLFGGMTVFDSINHAFTTMATGGFSTKQDSIAFFQSPFIHYIIVLFMFLAGTNYTLIFFGFRGKFGKFFRNSEFKAYFLFTLLVSLLITTVLFVKSEMSLEESFRDALFQVVSVITTTGFVSSDFTQWSAGVTFLFALLIFVGGSSGSTSGGIKIVRHLAIVKNCFLEFRRIIHPRAILPVKLNGGIVMPAIITNIMVFVLIYLIIFLLSSLILSAFGMKPLTAIGAAATALSNVGPGLGDVGPVNNFYSVPFGAKWFLAFLMLVGRLELFTVLVILSPHFWKIN